MISERFIGWIAIAVISFVVGLMYKYNALMDRQLQILAGCLLLLGVLLHIISRRFARLTVMRRRCMYKGFWRRIDRGDLLNQHEEESIALLGRIKGNKTTTLLMTVGALSTLHIGSYYFALMLAIGLVFLFYKALFRSQKFRRGFASRF